MEPRLVELNASEEGVNVERLFHGRKCSASPSLHGSIRNELLSCMKPSKLQFSQTLFFTKEKQLKSRHAEFRWFKHLGISRKDNMIPSCDSSSLFVRPDLRKFTINVARVFTRKGACLTRQTSFLPSVSVKSTEKKSNFAISWFCTFKQYFIHFNEIQIKQRRSRAHRLLLWLKARGPVDHNEIQLAHTVWLVDRARDVAQWGQSASPFTLLCSCCCQWDRY